LTQVYYLLVAEKQIEDLEKLGLNERQIRAMDYVIKRGFIRNKEYTSLNNVSRKTSTMDLTQLVTKGLLLSVGEGGEGRKEGGTNMLIMFYHSFNSGLIQGS